MIHEIKGNIFLIIVGTVKLIKVVNLKLCINKYKIYISWTAIHI